MDGVVFVRFCKKTYIFERADINSLLRILMAYTKPRKGKNQDLLNVRKT